MRRARGSCQQDAGPRTQPWFDFFVIPAVVPTCLNLLYKQTSRYLADGRVRCSVVLDSQWFSFCGFLSHFLPLFFFRDTVWVRLSGKYTIVVFRDWPQVGRQLVMGKPEREKQSRQQRTAQSACQIVKSTMDYVKKVDENADCSNHRVISRGWYRKQFYLPT